MKKLVFLALTLILVLVAAGCGMGEEEYITPAVTSTQTQMAIPVEESSGIFKGVGEGDSYVPAPVIVTQTTTSPHNGSYDYDIAGTERMVIKSANMALVVEDVSSTLQQIANLAAVNGGFVVSSDMREDQSRLYANISFRVAADKFDSTLQSLRSIAVDVRSESTMGQDVTEEYTDLDAKLRNLEASEAQLLVLMEKAGTVEEILKVQQELVNTREDIEVIKGRMQYLEQSTALSYIYVSLEQSKLTVEFMANTSTVKEGKSVRFIPTISGGFEPYSYEWNFGDGVTSTEAVPAHAYKKDGAYTVTLTIKDDKGSTAFAERKDYITVLTGWDAGNIVSNIWSGLVGFGRFLLTVVIALGIFSPVWIVVLVILYFTWWRRRKKKSQ